MIRRLLLFLSLASPALATTQVFVYPSTSSTPISVPIGTYQTFTAYVVGQNDKTVTWSVTAGPTLVGTNPCVANEPCTIAVYKSTVGGPYTLTATANTGGVTATSTITFTATPTPVTTHPRLAGINASNLSAIQAKAVGGNTLYSSGLKAFGITLFNTYNAKWNWSCGGGPSNTKTGQPTDDESYYSLGNYTDIFAALAVADPADATYHWGCYAHDAWLYYANVFGFPLNPMYTSATLPFRNSYALQGGSSYDAFQLIPPLFIPPDWLQGSTNGSGTWLMDGSGATMTATLTSGTMNLPTITAGGSGYTPGTIVYWYAPVGSSGCANIGQAWNGYVSTNLSGGTPMAAMGVVQTNSSGVVSGTVTTLTNATGCTTAPTIQVTSDKQVARNFMQTMAQSSILDTDGYGTSPPTTGLNSSAQFSTGSGFDLTSMRQMGNNYTERRHMEYIAAGLTFNDTVGDDPALPNSCSATRYVVCTDGTAGSLRAYFKTYEVGAMLYKHWAHIEDPQVSWQAYNNFYANLPTKPMCGDIVNTTNTVPQVPCLGDGRGGESSEGSWYKESMWGLAMAALSLQSAGVNDPLTYGPQMSFISSSWWDQKANSDLSELAYTWAGQSRWAYPGTGDVLQLYRLPNDYQTEAYMLEMDALSGRTDRSAGLEWIDLYTSINGISGFYSNLNNGNGYLNAVPLFLALPSGDPTASPPSDPRPSLPTDTYNGAYNQHIQVRSLWASGNGPDSPSDTGSPTPTTQQVFNLYMPNTRIDHEHQLGGTFSVLSNGEYITLQRTPVSNSYNTGLVMAEHVNILGLAANQAQTTCSWTSTQFFESPACQGVASYAAQKYVNGSITYPSSPNNFYNCTGAPCLSTDTPGTAGDWVTTTATKGGGQLWHGLQAGNAVLAHSELPAYVAANADTTQLYNSTAVAAAGCCAGVTGVTAASRSILYLRGSKQVVTYDREAGSLFSRLWMTTTGPITITGGNTASWPTRSNTQTGYWTTLLPTTRTMSDAGAYLTNENGQPGTSDWEPYSHVLIDAGSPASTQFLSVLEWGALGFTKSATSLVSSTGGQNFDCALIATTMTCFWRNWPGTFTGTTVPASTATTYYFSDLAPNTTYTISGTGAPGSGTTDNAGTMTFAATGTGNIVIAASSTVANPTCTPPAGTYSTTQSVTCSSATGGSTTVCTIDGSTPNHGSPVCTSISIATTLTLKALSFESGFTDSSVVSNAYTITPASPTSLSGKIVLSGKSSIVIH